MSYFLVDLKVSRQRLNSFKPTLKGTRTAKILVDRFDGQLGRLSNDVSSCHHQKWWKIDDDSNDGTGMMITYPLERKIKRERERTLGERERERWRESWTNGRLVAHEGGGGCNSMWISRLLLLLNVWEYKEGRKKEGGEWKNEWERKWDDDSEGGRGGGE